MKVNLDKDGEISLRLNSEDNFYLMTSFLSDSSEFSSPSYRVYISISLEDARKLARELELALREAQSEVC